MKLIVSAVICAVMFALGFQAAGAQNTAKTQAKLNTAPQFFARLPRFSFPLGQSTCADKQFSKIKNLVLVRSNSPDVPEDLEGPAGGALRRQGRTFLRLSALQEAGSLRPGNPGRCYAAPPALSAVRDLSTGVAPRVQQHRRRDLRPRRRPCRYRDLVGRRAPGIRGRPRPPVDGSRPGVRDGRELAAVVPHDGAPAGPRSLCP